MFGSWTEATGPSTDPTPALCVRVCVFVCSCTYYILSTKNTHSTSKVRIFWLPPNFKGLFEDEDLVLSLGLELD